MKLLIPVLDLAGGSLGELSPAQAAGLASQALKAFGISADDAAIAVDRMLQAVNVFALNASELPMALGNASRGAQALHQSMSETLISLGLVKNIIPGIERASTEVAVAMERLADPKVQQALRGVGVSVTDSGGHFRNFLDILGELSPALSKMTDAKRSAFLIDTFGAHALGSVQAADVARRGAQAWAAEDTRELMDLRVYDGWDVDSTWTIHTFNAILARTKRKPIAVLHDHGTHFMGQFKRQLRVLEVEDELTPVGMPSLNCYAESAIGSLRRELLRHIRIADAGEPQLYLDEWRRYVNTDRAHQGIEGRTPEERSTGEPVAKVISLAEVRARRLVRREYAKGLLHGYDLVANNVAGNRDAA